jgi:hypothetical protein
MNRSILASTGLLVFAFLGWAQAEERVGYGDTPEFWEKYALVVATVGDVQHRDTPDLVESVVTLSVAESVPSRYERGTKFSMTFVRNLLLIPVRDRPQYATTLQTGDRVMLMVTEERGKLVPALPRVDDRRLLTPFGKLRPSKLPLAEKPELVEAEGLDWFATVPNWRLNYPQEEDALVAETLRVARALSEKNPSRRLELIEAIQKARPDDRVQDLLRRSLESTLKSSQRQAEEAKRLLEVLGRK